MANLVCSPQGRKNIDTISRLSIEIDSSQAATAAADLEKLGTAARNLVPSIDRFVQQGGTVAQAMAGLQQAGAANAQTLQQLAGYYQQTGQAAQQSAAAVSAAAATTSRSAAAMGQLTTAAAGVAAGTRALNAEFARFEPLAVQQQRIIQGLAAGYLNAETAAQAWVLAERGAAEAARGGGGGGGSASGGSTGLRNFQLTNASEQLRQFIEQISFGTPAIQAFAQQAPQALVGFGPWAAILGVAAVAVGGLITALPGLVSGTQDAAKAAKEQEQATNDLLKALNVSVDSVDELRAGLAGLSTQQRSLVGADLSAGLRAQSAAFDEASKKVADYGQSLGKSASFGARVREMIGAAGAPEAGAAIGAGPGFGAQTEQINAITAASQDLQNHMQALGAGVGTFDDVAAAIRRLGDAQREGGAATAAQRVEIEGQIDKLAPLASADEAARQALFLHTAQVHEFLAAMGQKGAITAFDELILQQAEVAKGAAAAMAQLNTAHRALVAGQVADRIRASDIPNAAKEADDFLTRELAKGPAEEFSRGQETKTAQATIVFKGDTSQAQKALDLLKEAGTNVGERFEQTEERLKALGQQLGTPFPAVQDAIAKARLEADKLIASQRQAAAVQALVQAGFSPEKAQQQASAIASGTKGLNERAQTVASITEAERARTALAAKGPGFERETAAAAQEVVQLQGKLHEIDERRAKTAQSHADALRSQAVALLAQESPEAALVAAEQKIADLRRQGGLRSGAEATQASTGAFEKYADAVAAQATKGVQGQGQRVQLQAQITALQAAEVQHGEARVEIEQRLGVAKAALLTLDLHDADAIDRQVQAADKALQRTRVQLAQAQRGGGVDLGERVTAAGEQAAASIPGLSDEQARSPGAAGAAVRIASMREEAQTNAEAAEKAKIHAEAIRSLNDPMQTLAEEQGRLNDLLRGGYITEGQYTQALQRRTVAAQQAARQQHISDLLNTGEPGSGVGLGGQVAAGAQAAGLQYVEQYGNVAKATAGALTEMGQDGVDALLQLSQGAEVSAGAVVKSLALIIEKTLLTIAVARLLQAAFGGAAPTGTPVSGLDLSGGSQAVGGSYVYHTGGVVGDRGPSRAVDPMIFAGAPRYHAGGMVGPGEYPIIAKAGERVLTPDQSRQWSGGSGQPVVHVNITNNAGADVSGGAARRNPDGSMSLDVIVERKVNDLAARGRLDKGIKGRFDTDKRLY